MYYNLRQHVLVAGIIMPQQQQVCIWSCCSLMSGSEDVAVELVVVGLGESLRIKIGFEEMGIIAEARMPLSEQMLIDQVPNKRLAVWSAYEQQKPTDPPIVDGEMRILQLMPAEVHFVKCLMLRQFQAETERAAIPTANVRVVMMPPS